jgi:hypothetical protein
MLPPSSEFKFIDLGIGLLTKQAARKFVLRPKERKKKRSPASNHLENIENKKF